MPTLYFILLGIAICLLAIFFMSSGNKEFGAFFMVGGVPLVIGTSLGAVVEALALGAGLVLLLVVLEMAM